MLEDLLVGFVFIVIGIIFGVFLWDLKDSVKREYSALDKFKYAACVGGTVACAIIVIIGAGMAYTSGCDIFMGNGGTRLFG